MGQAAEELR